MDLINLIVIILSAYWLSTIMADDTLGGPFGLLARLRQRAGVRYDEYNQVYAKPGSLGEMLICPYCNSIWSGLLVTFLFAGLYYAGLPAALVLAPLAAGGFIVLVSELTS